VAGTIARLYVRPAYAEFGPGQHAALAAALAALTRHTLVAEVGSSRDLVLDDDGRLPDGYRYTSNGLKQVCALLAPGLFQAVRDLSGIDRAPDGDRDEYDFKAAIGVYNRVVDLRGGPRLGDSRLLRHAGERLVEGVLGPRYAMVENSDVLDRADEAAAGRDGGPAFRHAVLSGRRLLLRYVAAAPLFVAANGDRWHDGIHFANSEVGGESTFRAAALLCRGGDDAYALGPFLGGKHVHVGRKLGDKMARAFADAAAAAPDAARLAARARALGEASLGIDDAREDRLRDRVAALVSRLRGRGVPITAAERAVALAARGGRGPEGGPRSRVEPGAWSHYDLFAALTREARTLYATAQESVERAAHDLLTGKFKIN
jgi:hypothetical protein